MGAFASGRPDGGRVGRVRWDGAPGETFVKICGITTLPDAQAALEAGADAVGFVFAPSPRQVSPDQAAAIAQALPPGIARFGVFVDSPVAWMLEVAARAGLDGVQLQGAEPSGAIDQLQAASLFVTRAVRVVGGALPPQGGAGADALMVDSKDPARPEVAAGQVPLAGLRDWLQAGRPARLMVAGGLHAANVGEVVRTLRPWGVDVSGGVESSPGRKDPARIQAFVAAVRGAQPAALANPTPATTAPATGGAG